MTQATQMPDWMQERLAGTAQAPGEVQIAPDEMAAFSLFITLGTQWRWCAMSGARLGLDYTAIPAAAAMQALEMTPALFRDLRVMEAEVLTAQAEGRRK